MEAWMRSLIGIASEYPRRRDKGRRIDTGGRCPRLGRCRRVRRFVSRWQHATTDCSDKLGRCLDQASIGSMAETVETSQSDASGGCARSQDE
jgi:hypothetical protein